MSDWLLNSIIVSTILLLIGACVISARYDNDQWQRFSRENHCISVGVQKGQYVYGGKGGWTSDQTIYKCDNGAMVIR